MILICISSNILSFECGDSFSNTMQSHFIVMTCSCQFVLSYYHTILTQHIIFIITAYSTVSHSCAMIFLMTYAHVSYYIYTIKHDMPHFIYTCTHVLHNINLVMSWFILNVSFYPTYTSYKISILKTLCMKSQ